jgi:PAS domain S-box-containing protein
MRSELELLRAIVDAVPSMLAYWDSDLRCRFANRAYEVWFGVAPEALYGKHISELLGPLYQLNLPHIQAALRGEPQTFEREIPDPQGGPSRHSLAHYLPDVASGVVVGFFVLVTDISEIKRTELALRESEERFRLTLDGAPIGMALVALDGRFLRVNRRLCEIVGYTADELVGLTFQAITHPADLDADLAMASQLQSGEIPRYELEKRYVHKDGTVVDVLLSGSLLRSRGGRPVHFIAQIEEITERKRAASQQRFLAEVGPLLASTLDYQETLKRTAEIAVREIADVCIIDIVVGGGEIRRIQVAARDPAKRWVSDGLKSLRIDAGRPFLLSEALRTRRAVLLERPTSAEIDVFAQSDEHLRLLRGAEIRSLIAVPLVAHGDVLGGIVLISSGGSRFYGPSDLRVGEELARRAALAMTNARLYEAARHATAVRDEVVSLVAHDLRNPLNAVMLNAESLRRLSERLESGADPSTLRLRRPVENITHAAGRMNRLIQDLLDVTRIEARGLSVETRPVAVVPLIGEVLDSQRALAGAASLELVAELPDWLPAIAADRDRVLQVLENLIGNAMKFTPTGGRITLAAEVHDNELVFRVADTGAGIPPEAVTHAFDRFWQASRARRTGAGLGLAIVKGIVEAHGGRIWIESQVGRGTTVSFTIPVAQAARPALEELPG